ncbi:unnamed protein product [Closterium sp. Naga37s-1]|nr:unnamed protein product [Closterium sp. Naga37s-1]
MSFPTGFAKLPPFGTAEAAASAAAAAAAGTKRRAEDALEGSGAGSGGAGGGGSISGGSSAGASRRKLESSGLSPPQLPPPKTAPSALQGRPPTPPTAASAAAAALVALAPPPALAAQQRAAAQQQAAQQRAASQQQAAQRQAAQQQAAAQQRQAAGMAAQQQQPRQQQQQQQQQAAGGLHVRALWLTVSPTERYLLLEDQETGDVLMPLIHMRVMSASLTCLLGALWLTVSPTERYLLLEDQERPAAAAGDGGRIDAAHPHAREPWCSALRPLSPSPRPTTVTSSPRSSTASSPRRHRLVTVSPLLPPPSTNFPPFSSPSLLPISPSTTRQKMFEADYSRKLSSLKHRLFAISPVLAASRTVAATPLTSPLSPSHSLQEKMFEANYSRKLSSLKHRLVTISPDLAASAAAASALPSPPALLQGFLYWRWAFESPHEVKVLVRKMLGEENTPQGHLRLILVPIVYNAMALKENLRKTPFFAKLEAALRVSSYWQLLKPQTGTVAKYCVSYSAAEEAEKRYDAIAYFLLSPVPLSLSLLSNFSHQQSALVTYTSLSSLLSLLSPSPVVPTFPPLNPLVSTTPSPTWQQATVNDG